MKKKVLMLLSLALIGSARLQAQNWVNGGNSLSSSGRIGTNTNYSLLFETNNSERGRITNTGLWGIGTTAPNSRLHINSITNQDPLRVQVNNSTKLLVHRGGGVSVGVANVPPANGLLVGGLTGFGTTDPGYYQVKIAQNGAFGLDIQNTTTLDDWELYVSGSGELNLYANGSNVGSFNPDNGVYSSISDERLKTNIKAMPSILNKVNQLKPATYQFKPNAKVPGNKPEQYGFLAQEVLKVFPQLVTHTVSKERNLDQYIVDYSGFGVIAIKAIQEQQQTIQEQKQAIQEQKQLIQQLQQENNDFKDRLIKIEAAIGSVKDGLTGGLNGASMLQVFPNPARETTTFNYSINKGASGKILVYNASGQLVRTLAAPDSGQVQMNANSLSAGKYTATLIVDGKVITSNHMLVQ